MGIVKLFSHLFYRTEVEWIGQHPEKPWNDMRLLVFLNHTSLYEPIFVSVFPWSFMYRFVSQMMAPGASKTLNRPIVGLFYKLTFPGMVSISRKRDSTWTEYMKTVDNEGIIVIAPEGRMKREGGLDKDGKKMTVRGGIADIISELEEGKMILAFSQGLHHVQIPGQRFPRLFQTIKIKLEYLDIAEYKKNLPQKEGVSFKRSIVNDMQERLEKNAPEV